MSWARRHLTTVGCMVGAVVVLGSSLYSDLSEKARRTVGIRALDDQERQEAALSLAGGVAPPGARGLSHAGMWPGVPKALGTALRRLDPTERLRVRFTTENMAAVEVLVTLTQVGSSFEMATVARDDREGPRNVVTVVDGVAYIDDVGLRFDRPRARYRIKLHEHFSPDVFVRWWDRTRIDSDPFDWTVTAGPKRGETTFVGVDPEDRDRRRFVVTSDGWLRESAGRFGSTQFEQVDERVEIRVPDWASGPDDPVPTTWAEALAADPSLLDLLDRVVEVIPGPSPARDSDIGPLASQCGSSPYTPARRQGVPPLPDRSLFRCQIKLADLPTGSGLPATGVLQLYLEKFDGFARYFPAPTVGDHDADAARKLVEQDWPDGGSPGRPFPAFRLSFAAGHTSSDDAIYSRGPRRWRYDRRAPPYPDRELAAALAPLGVRYIDNDVDLIGGRWLANGRTPDGFVRLFMVGDDVGYSYWHIPKKDLAAGRFDRVEGGWTD